jgi:hypothetical protein
LDFDLCRAKVAALVTRQRGSSSLQQKGPPMKSSSMVRLVRGLSRAVIVLGVMACSSSTPSADDVGPATGGSGGRSDRSGGSSGPSSGGTSGGSGGQAGGSVSGGSSGSAGGSAGTGSGGDSGSGGGSAGGTGGATSGNDGGGTASDVPVTPPAGAVETVDVPASGDAVTLKTSLAMGEIYLLQAKGVVDLGGQKLDAEYAFGTGMPADESSGADVGIDTGVKQLHAMVHRTPTPAGPGRAKWFGYDGYRDDHVYAMTVTGEGKPLSLKLVKPTGAAGTGSISVSLLQLSPAPPKALGTELETVMVPVAKTIVMSAMSTVAGKLYILQAAGRGKVGGGGTHEGDADYMDWTETGMGANEGEAGADFGIGVDELELKLMPYGAGGYKARLRWWGPWRMDHTYYMPFTGTGKPIQFLYFDSGYGDNGTDKLTVKIFAAP